jgi:hypothetical protein
MSPCSWCELEGRCIRGKKVYWSGKGRHESPCWCVCHIFEPAPDKESK